MNYKSLQEIDAVGTNDEGSFVDRDGTLWMPVPQREDAYQPIYQDGGPPFLQRLTFHFAKSMAEVPHWWTRCAKEPPRHEDFWALYEAINKFGVSELWNGRRYKYWYPGNGFRYWHLGSYYRIVNRSRAEVFGRVAEELKEKAADWKLRDERTGIDEIRARRPTK